MRRVEEPNSFRITGVSNRRQHLHHETKEERVKNGRKKKTKKKIKEGLHVRKQREKTKETSKINQKETNDQKQTKKRERKSESRHERIVKSYLEENIHASEARSKREMEVGRDGLKERRTKRDEAVHHGTLAMPTHAKPQ